MMLAQERQLRAGSMRPVRRTIRLNTELARKPQVCLGQIPVHELAQLHESRHNCRFREMMDRHLPNWQETRQTLNRPPLAHDE